MKDEDSDLENNEIEKENEIQDNTNNKKEKENNNDNIKNLDENLEDTEVEKLDNNNENNITETEENVIKDNNEIENIPQVYYPDEINKPTYFINLKIKEFKQNYNFCIEYHKKIFNITNFLLQIIYDRIKNSINDNLNYISFFKSLSELYSNFSDSLKNSNNILPSSEKLLKMNDNFLQEVMQNVQNAIQISAYKMSNSLKQIISSEDPFSKVKEKVNIIKSIKEDNLKKTYEINTIKNQLEKKYSKTYQNFFESEIKSSNVSEFPDLVFGIQELLEQINKIILEINLFIIDIKDSLLTVNHLFNEINDLVKNSVIIYIRDSKTIFNEEVSQKFNEIEKYFKQKEKTPEEEMFNFDQILTEDTQKNKIIEYLEQYDNFLSESGRIKIEKNEKNPFLISNYQNIYSFFEFLVSISPQPTHLTIEELISKKFEIKMNQGLLKGWRDCVMVYTKQNHIIICDKPNNYSLENIIQVFQIDKIDFRLNSNFKQPFIFEIISNSSGIFMNYQGTYTFDALNNKNLYELCLIFKDYINKNE